MECLEATLLLNVKTAALKPWKITLQCDANHSTWRCSWLLWHSARNQGLILQCSRAHTRPICTVRDVKSPPHIRTKPFSCLTYKTSNAYKKVKLLNNSLSAQWVELQQDKPSIFWMQLDQQRSAESLPSRGRCPTSLQSAAERCSLCSRSRSK